MSTTANKKKKWTKKSESDKSIKKKKLHIILYETKGLIGSEGRQIQYFNGNSFFFFRTIKVFFAVVVVVAAAAAAPAAVCHFLFSEVLADQQSKEYV